MVAGLADDHANALFLARELAVVPGLSVDVDKVQSNIVFINVVWVGVPVATIVAQLKQRGVLINNVGPDHLRIVTHFDAPRTACEKALVVVQEVIASLKV